MDPDKCLNEIRETVLALKEAGNRGNVIEAYGLGETLADNVQALDEWLTKGGFLPMSWERVP